MNNMNNMSSQLLQNVSVDAARFDVFLTMKRKSHYMMLRLVSGSYSY